MPMVARVMILTINLETSQSPDGTSASSSEVSWQTCFWILVTFGLNTMFQPCGRVCGAKIRYSTYLRSSPFVCMADVISLLVKLYTFLRSGMPIRTCIHYIIVERFEVNGSLEEMEKAKRTAWIRWLFFVLVLLPQAIQLACYRSTPWTQIFGFSFVSSWLVVEILVLIPAKPTRENTGSWTPGTFKGLHLFNLQCGLGCNLLVGLVLLTPFAIQLPML